MNTESPTTAKPKRERTPEQKAKAAAKERERRAAKKAPSAVEFAVVVIDGESYQVSAAMTTTERENAARLMHEAHVARKNGTADAPTPDVDRVSPVTAARAAVAARKSAAKLPAGHAKFALSTSAYGVLLAADLDPRIVKALKASDKVRSATKAANLPYHFPVMTLDDTATCAAVLAATAKDWEKLPSKERGGNLASIKRYAETLREISKGA